MTIMNQIKSMPLEAVWRLYEDIRAVLKDRIREQRTLIDKQLERLDQPDIAPAFLKLPPASRKRQS